MYYHFGSRAPPRNGVVVSLYVEKIRYYDEEAVKKRDLEQTRVRLLIL